MYQLLELSMQQLLIQVLRDVFVQLIYIRLNEYLFLTLETADTKPVTTSGSKSGKSKGKKSAPVPNESSSSDETFIEILFIEKSQLTNELKLFFNEIPDDLLDSLVEYFLKY